MATSLLATKLFIPPARPGLVPRPRLMQRLKSAMTCSLTLVSASAGFGKSTVLAQWISGNKLPAGTPWVSLDEGDNDPVRFWDYFISALKTIKPDIGETSLGLLHSPQPCPAESVLTALINDLTDIKDDFAVVLDDYHLINAEPVHYAVVFLLERMPPKMHLVIGTRADPPLHLSRLRGRGQMAEIGADDLRFTLEETTELFKETQGLVLSEEDVTALNTCTEGWAVGLKMAGLSMRGQKDVGKFLASFTGSQRYVMDYLTEELLKQQPAEIRDFFLKTSVLDRLTGPLSDCLTGHKGGDEELIKLEAAFGGFLIPLDESRQWYRYHHLLAELLRHQLERVSGAEEVTRLHRKASQWYQDNDFPDEAIHHALAAQDWERAMILLDGVVDNRLKRGENVTVLNWLRVLPDESLRTDLHLFRQYVRSLVQTGQLESAESALGFLETAAHEDANMQGEVAAFKADIAMRTGDMPRARELAERALSLLPLKNPAYRCRASHILGIVAHDGGLYDEAWARMKDAYESGWRAGDHLTAIEAFSYLGNILHLQGKLERAAELSRQAIEMAGQSPAAGPGWFFSGVALYELNRLEESAHDHQIAVDLLAIRGSPDNIANSNMGLARARLALGDLPAALAAMERSVQLPGHGSVRPATRARLAAYRTLLAIQQEDLSTASHWSIHLSECAGALSFQFHHVPARLLIARGDRAAAAEQLERLHREALQRGALSLVIEIRVYQSLAAAAPEEALTFLAEALALGRPEGFIRTFVDEGRLLAPVLRQALSAGITPEYAHKLLKIIEEEERRRKALNPEAVPCVPPSSLLTERELEILRLVAAGHSNREIAAKLIIALGTAKTHVHSIFEKLNAKDRLQAVTRARELRLVP